MPNYNLVSNAVFTPFSYERYLQPYEANEKDFREIQEAIANYDDLTSSWRDKLDSSVKDQYDNYYKALESGRDRLLKEGLTSGSRNLLMNIRRGYAKEITPIEESYKRKQEYADEQRKLSANNPYVMFDRDYSTNEVSLRDLMNNPNLGYRTINGKDIYNEGLNMATAASARKFSKDTVDKYNAIKQGYGEDEAVRFLQNTSEFADLQNGLNKILESTDAPDKLKARVESYAMKGIMDGLKVNMDFSTPLQKTQSDLAWAKFDDDKEWRTSTDNPSYMVAKAKVASLNRAGSGSSKIPDNYIGQYSYVTNAKGKTRILESDKKMKIPDPLTITSNNYDGLADWQKTLVKNALGLSKDSPNDKVREALENSIREFIVSDNEKAHKGKLSEENDIFTSIPKIKKTAPEEQEDINLDIE